MSTLPDPRRAARLVPPSTVGAGLLLAGATALISGLSVFVNASAVKAVPDPAVFTTLKNAVAAIVLLGLATAVVRPSDIGAIGRRDWGWLTAIGVIGGGIPFLLFFSGLAMASAPSAAFIHKTMFIWVALMAGPVLGERLGLAPIAALGVLLVGQALILPPLGIAWGLGETLIALATLLWAVEVIIARRVLGRVRSPIVGVARLGIGLIVLVGYLVVSGRLAGIATLDGAAWAWVVITGGLLSGYVATWLAALRRAPASQVSAMLVLGAVITGLLTTVSKGVLPDTTIVGGYALIALAVAAIAWIGLRRAAIGRPAPQAT
ncbi:MAG TPA: DMT family transporter [Candidatus Limnocylindrales bacterium]|jgi:drug/metabolite transporter (DMT)-like permease|nr:DMT family transporter [Candidatus Limnocylindrales bacterium]